MHAGCCVRLINAMLCLICLLLAVIKGGRSYIQVLKAVAVIYFFCQEVSTFFSLKEVSERTEPSSVEHILCGLCGLSKGMHMKRLSSHEILGC